MKLYIVTLPNMGNIGGILQSYALYRALQPWCPQVSLIDLGVKETRRARLQAGWRKLLYRAACACGGVSFWQRLLPARLRCELEWLQRMYSVMGGLPYTSLRRAARDAGGTFVIGSDQVWRAAYTRYMGLGTFFLDFAAPAARRRSMAYAASFGHDAWDATPAEGTACAPLARELRAISVREHSGVALCREQLGCPAVQMPDPAFLLHPADYRQLMGGEALPRQSALASYLLDHTATTRSVQEALCAGLALPLDELERIHDICHPHLDIRQWLARMERCSCVLTDSFHGCVFSILFNKPFVCIGNAGRGKARFDSLLQTFGLESRYVEEPQQVLAAMRAPIDWASVNTIRERERARGLAFLKENLLTASPPPAA